MCKHIKILRCCRIPSKVNIEIRVSEKSYQIKYDILQITYSYSDKGRGCAKSRFEENIYSRHTNNTMYILCSHRIGMIYGQAGPRGPTILAMPTINTPDLRKHARFVYILIITTNTTNERTHLHKEPHYASTQAHVILFIQR